MYELIVKKAYLSYRWGEMKEGWSDDVDEFDNVLDALAGLTLAMQEYPTHKIIFKVRPVKGE